MKRSEHVHTYPSLYYVQTRMYRFAQSSACPGGHGQDSRWWPPRQCLPSSSCFRAGCGIASAGVLNAPAAGGLGVGRSLTGGPGRGPWLSGVQVGPTACRASRCRGSESAAAAFNFLSSQVHWQVTSQGSSCHPSHHWSRWDNRASLRLSQSLWPPSEGGPTRPRRPGHHHDPSPRPGPAAALARRRRVNRDSAASEVGPADPAAGGPGPGPRLTEPESGTPRPPAAAVPRCFAPRRRPGY